MTQPPVEGDGLAPSHAPGAHGPARRVAVLVLGMHRSGTSALARVFNLLGCALPRTLLPASDGNLFEHWESDPVRALNDQILETVGSSWNDWLAVGPRPDQAAIWTDFVGHARRVVEDQFDGAPLFVLKDPRICRLAGVWLDALAADEIDPAIVIPLRNPQEVARSLKVRDDIDESYTLLTWLRHVLDAEAGTRSRRRVFSSYDELLTDWDGLAQRVGRELGFSWPNLPAGQVQQVDAFISLDRRHHSERWLDVRVDPAIPPWVVNAYEILQRWAQTGEESADHARLDAIRSAFDTATPAFAAPLQAATRQGWRAASLHAELAAARVGLASAEAQLRDGKSHMDDQADRHAAASEALTEQRDAALADVAALGAELGRMREELAASENALRQVAITVLRNEAEMRSAQAETRLQSLLRTGAANASEKLRSEIMLLRKAADQAGADCIDARNQLASALAEVGVLRERESVAALAVSRVQWLRSVFGLLSASPRWWALLPESWRHAREHRSLKKHQLFEADAYLSAYPDVRMLRVDPLVHYILFGMQEGRKAKTVDERLS